MTPADLHQALAPLTAQLHGRIFKPSEDLASTR